MDIWFQGSLRDRASLLLPVDRRLVVPDGAAMVAGGTFVVRIGEAWIDPRRSFCRPVVARPPRHAEPSAKLCQRHRDPIR